VGRIALAQIDCTLFDKETNLKNIEEVIENTGGSVNLIVFPELFLTGYSISEKLFELAESIEGPSIIRLKEIARQNHISIVIGFPEKDINGKIYNSAVLLNERGEIQGISRKVHLYGKEQDMFSPGDSLEVFNTVLGTVGVTICYDFEFPENIRALAIKGAQIVIVISANMFPWHKHQEIYSFSRAMENQIFLALANRIGTENDLVFCGRSCVISPNGEVLVKAVKEATILSCDINTNLIQDVRKGGTYYLRDGKPYIFKKIYEYWSIQSK
jgi:predicted amidohydrolase